MDNLQVQFGDETCLSICLVQVGAREAQLDLVLEHLKKKMNK